MSDEEMQRHFEGGSRVKGTVFALVGERIYKRESGGWRLLDNRPYCSLDEMIEAQRGS